MTVTFTMIVWAVGLFGVWNGLLLGAIKWLLSREVARFESKLDAADAKAGKALKDLAEHKDSTTTSLANMRLEFQQKNTCANHQRMESDNEKQFLSLDKMHASIRGISEKINGVANNVDLLLKHHIDGGRS